MPKKRYKPEEIVAKLRQVDVLMSQGQKTAEVIRQITCSSDYLFNWQFDMCCRQARLWDNQRSPNSTRRGNSAGFLLC
jgi:hypothetical protein